MSDKEEEDWHVLVDCVHRGENKFIFMSELRATNILSGSIDQHNWVEYCLKENDDANSQKLHFNFSFLLMEFIWTQSIDLIHEPFHIH